jgi:hypothetical protein
MMSKPVWYDSEEGFNYKRIKQDRSCFEGDGGLNHRSQGPMVVIRKVNDMKGFGGAIDKIHNFAIRIRGVP